MNTAYMNSVKHDCNSIWLSSYACKSRPMSTKSYQIRPTRSGYRAEVDNSRERYLLLLPIKWLILNVIDWIAIFVYNTFQYGLKIPASPLACIQFELSFFMMFFQTVYLSIWNAVISY